MVDISIVVGTYNRLDHIKRCVESVCRETTRPYRLFVTDAGSTDGTIEYLNSVRSEFIQPIFVGKKLGQARAYNDVLRTIKSPYVCWLSDDNELVNGALDLSLQILDDEPKIGMVGLKVKDTQGPFVDAPYVGGVSKLGILNVNQGVLRTKLFEQVGYFSEVFRDYGIDPDLTAKVLLSGYDVVYTKDICVHHQRLWETDKTSPAYAAQEAKNARAAALYYAKYKGWFDFDLLWLAKRASWKALRIAGGRFWSINSKRKLWGLVLRDWNNVLASRYISLLDAARCRNKPYYLRQVAPSHGGYRALPQDPRPEGEAI